MQQKTVLQENITVLQLQKDVNILSQEQEKQQESVIQLQKNVEQLSKIQVQMQTNIMFNYKK